MRIRSLLWLGACALLLACVAERRQTWPVYEPPAEPRLEPGAVLSSDLPDDGPIPRASDYPAPSGSQLWLSGEGPPLFRPVGSTALAEARAAGRTLLGSILADLDLDGAPETVALYAARDDEHVLEVHAAGSEEPVARRRFRPVVDRGRRCHLDVRLLGALRTTAGERPLLWHERGVGCAAFEGGGYERHLIVEIPSRDQPVEIPIFSVRHLEAGAVDVYEAAVWRAASSSGAESLFFRGIFRARRSCTHPDAGFWVEELVYRRLEADGSLSAWREGRALPLSAGVLPPDFLRSRMAPCR